MDPMFMQRVMQMMQRFQNPVQMIRQMLPGLPEGIQNDPNQIISWMQQTGKITEQQIQAARQLMGGK